MLEIALIDDRSTNRKLLSKLTSSVEKDLVIHTFEDGQEAYDWTRHNSPDLVITDFDMPRMNGEEFIKAFRQEEKFKKIPIIVLTAHDDEEFRMRALEAGATDFLQRPINHQEFQVRVRNLLTLRKQQILIEQQGRRQLRAILDAVPAMVSTVDENDNFLFINKYMGDVLGLTLEECAGKSVQEVYSQAGLRRNFQQTFNENLSRPFEESLVDVEGNERIFLTSKVPLAALDPDMTEDVTISIDITQRKRAERQVKNQGEYFRGIIDNESNLIFTANDQGNITLANQSFAQICGAPLPNIIGKTLGELEVNFSDIDPSSRQLLDASSEMFEQRITTKEGESIWFQTVRTPIQGIVEGEYETLYVMSNITKLVSQTQQLARSKEIAESANLSKTEFLANMSHELRTPLNAIINFSDVMREGIFGPLNNDKYLEYVGDIRDSGIHLLSIINDVLDISKIESGEMAIRKEEVAIEEVVQTVVRLTRHKIEDAHLDLSIHMDPGLPAVDVDPTKAKQILLNLISNAVKFTPENGHIDLDITQRDDFLLISVKDTGIGIKEEDIEKALKRFGQLESHLTRKYSGSGLGLSLVKKLVELQGGEFSLTSVVGVGTTATFTLPILSLNSTQKQGKMISQYEEYSYT